MSKSKIKVILNDNAENFFKEVALEHVNKNGLDIKCPKCDKEIHISFSGDTCKFCGLTIRYGTEPND